MGYNINLIHYCFLIVPLEENKDCIYYWGEFTDINPDCNTINILNMLLNGLFATWCFPKHLI